MANFVDHYDTRCLSSTVLSVGVTGLLSEYHLPYIYWFLKDKLYVPISPSYLPTIND